MNDRSRIDQNARDLCGITAMGDTFNYSCGERLNSPIHSTIVTLPMRSLSNASDWIYSIASGVIADSCGPLSIAAWIISLVQPYPVSAGQPFVVYWSSRSAAG